MVPRTGVYSIGPNHKYAADVVYACEQCVQRHASGANLERTLRDAVRTHWWNPVWNPVNTFDVYRPVERKWAMDVKKRVAVFISYKMACKDRAVLITRFQAAVEDEWWDEALLEKEWTFYFFIRDGDNSRLYLTSLGNFIDSNPNYSLYCYLDGIHRWVVRHNNSWRFFAG